jgi:uncharacterized protein (TIGR02466 family)
MANTSDAWIEASDVMPIFPTLLWKIVIKPQLRDSIEAAALPALAAMKRDPAKLEPGHGWQSEQTLHQRAEFAQLVTCIQAATRSILRFLRVGPEAFEITGCWATVLGGGAAHKLHSHPNNYLSGVYYLRTHPGADTINFHDPRHQAGVIRPPVVELTGENTDQVVVRVTNGMMLLFPSYLEHSVDASGGDEERISISFNIMFSSFAEEISKPLW